MSINIQVFEETGAPVNGRGTVTEIDNFNWKNTSDVSQPYFSYPLRRPLKAPDQTNSFKRFIFFKISGTYSYIKNVKIIAEIGAGKQATKTQLFYKFSSNYVEPTADFDGEMINADNLSKSIVWHPNLGDSPILATSRPIIIGPNATVYSEYFVSQIRVNKGEWNDVGNTDEFKFKLSLQEFE